MTVNGASSAPELHEVEPREQIGAVTGDRYEFQYHQAAADTLALLDDTQIACVYFEWHDDYVIERAGVVSYSFHQVKTRARSQGPWTHAHFFGVIPRRRRARGSTSSPAPQTPAQEPKATTDSIFARLLDHRKKFGGRCEWFVFVTDGGISTDFEKLLDAVRVAPADSGMTGGEAVAFTKLFDALVTAFPDLTRASLFSFIKRLEVRAAVGILGKMRDFRTIIGARILDASEVNLTMTEAQKIGAELVALIRDRSHQVLDPLPSGTPELKAKKGLVLEDLLRVLSLSTAGYRALQTGGRDAVRALSRLHRLCSRSGVPAEIIPDLCGLKSAWDAWWLDQRHSIEVLDYVTLKKSCAEALHAHAAGTLSFEDLRSNATSLAQRYAGVFTSSSSLTEELVLGFMMTIAAEAEE